MVYLRLKVEIGAFELFFVYRIIKHKFGMMLKLSHYV